MMEYEKIKQMKTDVDRGVIIHKGAWVELLNHALEMKAPVVDYDSEAVAWAYGKCVALGMENSSQESAMFMDRLKAMLVYGV